MKEKFNTRQFLEEKTNISFSRLMPKPFEKLGVKEILKDKKDLVGMEIGVYKGHHSKAMLKLLDIRLLYLVDPYNHYEYMAYSQGKMQELKEKTIHYLRKYEHEIIWRFKKSTVIAHTFFDNYFDFIYLDGDHTYENVKKELKLYYPKLKKGGIFGGHDFQISTLNENENGVVTAVTEFIQEKNLKLYHAGDDWWVIK